nr:hypothetical protein [Tanacetum cinerariifolium]
MIAQSSTLPPVADKHASPLRDVSQGEACPIVSRLDAEQDRANITKTSTLPHESTLRVPSFAADEGSLQLRIPELTDLCTSLQRQQSDLVSKFGAQEVEITMLKARVKLLEDREGGGAERSGDDASIKERSLDEGEEVAEKGSNDTEEMINVLTSMDAATSEDPNQHVEDFLKLADILDLHFAVGNKMHKALPLPVMEFPLPEESEDPNQHVEDFLKLADILDLHFAVGNKMHKALPLPVMEFPLPEEVPTASEESSYCQKKRDATAHKIALLLKSSSNCQSKAYDSYDKLVPHVTLCILGITVIVTSCTRTPCPIKGVLYPL